MSLGKKRGILHAKTFNYYLIVLSFNVTSVLYKKYMSES